ncbi:MAG TPA: hypothetical protein VK893_14300, partial [Pyrinomonadaceae bacterium]|nr:hypothetical protein [Pyrinomonadaceae bacterium]
MTDIFRIETDRTNLSWSENRESDSVDSIQSPGRLAISAPNRTRKKIRIWRSGLPPAAATSADIELGPRLYEETPYSLLLS